MTTNEPNAWVSDEDFEELDDWPEAFPNEGHEISRGPQVQDEQPPGTPLPEYMDEEIAAELAGKMAPVWLGTRWREIPAEQQADAWNGLRRWVDWLIKEYWLTTSEIPPCWYRHSNIVAELYAAMCMEYKVWEENEPGLGPTMFWHTNLQQIIMRLKAMVDDAGCVRDGKHKEPIAYGSGPAHELNYDETDWESHVETTVIRKEIDRPGDGVLYVRAGLVDSGGAIVARSKPVGVQHHHVAQKPQVGIEYVSTNGNHGVLKAQWEHYTDEHELIWETSINGHDWEHYE